MNRRIAALAERAIVRITEQGSDNELERDVSLRASLGALVGVHDGLSSIWCHQAPEAFARAIARNADYPYYIVAVDRPRKEYTMPRYRVTLRRTTVEIVEAANPYQAAIVANDLGGEGVEIANVAPAVGRPSASSGPRKSASAAKKTIKKVTKKRRPMSPEARAKLAQNLVKARAARAAKHKAAKRATTKASRAVKRKRAAAKKR